VTRSTGPGAKPAFLALACVGFLASAPAFAADGETPLDEQDRQEIVVEGQLQAEVESPKATQPLLDTPQTVTVVSDQVIRKQNLLTLRDALATIPGITFGAGEGGGGYGDSINLRGYSANNDITVDGVRDSAQYSRTDPFNLQQIEVYNGANSVFNGSGSVGGTINLVSKVPQGESLSIFQGSIGTDDYYRAAADVNQRVSDLIAVRVNAVYHRNDVPGRDVEKYKRWGVAPSITIGVDGPTSLTLAYVHQRDDNVPIYGVPFFRNQLNPGPLPGVDPSDYFGIVNLDEQETTIDRLTATFRHSFSDSLSVRNLTRWQRVRQYSQTSAPQGTFCLANGFQPISAGPNNATGLACTVTINNVSVNGGPMQNVAVAVAPGMFQPNGPRGLVRDQLNQMLHNQTDFRLVSGEKGGLHNILVVGGSLSWEDYSITTASLARTAGGVAVLLPQFSFTNPSTAYAGPINFTVTARSKSSTANRAIYAFDTLEIGTMLELNAGVRYKHNRGEFRAIPLAAYPPGTAALTPAQQARQINEENLFSYRFGAVFKPATNISIYGAYGNSKTPSSASVRAGCGLVTNSPAGVADPCAVAPETGRNIEFGAKADLFGGVQLTAALFRNERSNFRVASNDPAQPTSFQVLDGRSRVDGIALGASGAITPQWTVFANYTYLDGEILQSISDFCLATPGAAGCNNSAANPDPQRGNFVLQAPTHSGSLFTTYRLPFGLELGYGMTYQGSFALNNATLTNPNQYRSDSYLIHRLFLSYTVTQGLTAQLNVQNLTDKLYYTSIRNNVNATSGAITGGWAAPGEGRSAVVSLFYSF
jgi:catecholate siderophore receptor